MESWAVCVETVLTNDRYVKRLSQTSYQYDYNEIENPNGTLKYSYVNSQGEPYIENGFYTSCLFDLNDDFNQNTQIPNNNLPNDDVKGSTLKEIQDIVLQSKSWDELKTNCKTKHPEINPGDIDNLLNYWN